MSFLFRVVRATCASVSLTLTTIIQHASLGTYFSMGVKLDRSAAGAAQPKRGVIKATRQVNRIQTALDRFIVVPPWLGLQKITASPPAPSSTTLSRSHRRA